MDGTMPINLPGGSALQYRGHGRGWLCVVPTVLLNEFYTIIVTCYINSHAETKQTFVGCISQHIFGAPEIVI